MGFHDRSADGKSHAHSGFLGREKSIEQVCRRLLTEAMAGIRYGQFDHVVRGFRAGGGKFPFRRFRHRLQGISKEVDEDLLNLHAVDEDAIAVRIQISQQHDVLFAGARETEDAGFFHQLRQAFDALLRFTP